MTELKENSHFRDIKDIEDKDEKYIFFDDISIYDLINENRSFYINEEGKIVVVFDKYEIACGAAGVLEFVIES